MTHQPGKCFKMIRQRLSFQCVSRLGFDQQMNTWNLIWTPQNQWYLFTLTCALTSLPPLFTRWWFQVISDAFGKLIISYQSKLKFSLAFGWQLSFQRLQQCQYVELPAAPRVAPGPQQNAAPLALGGKHPNGILPGSPASQRAATCCQAVAETWHPVCGGTQCSEAARNSHTFFEVDADLFEVDIVQLKVYRLQSARSRHALRLQRQQVWGFWGVFWNLETRNHFFWNLLQMKPHMFNLSLPILIMLPIRKQHIVFFRQNRTPDPDVMKKQTTKARRALQILKQMCRCFQGGACNHPFGNHLENLVTFHWIPVCSLGPLYWFMSDNPYTTGIYYLLTTKRPRKSLRPNDFGCCRRGGFEVRLHVLFLENQPTKKIYPEVN